ncbi:NfeD family protein [Aciduricibacillus chroicocephali]|uniref:NfeD family protein n=1 Tax=Aciduricibacillus chroicocephali TaxID=3054939 RepID=A0ABY9KVG9_9BACI|nr:NfeD family protein [Bacillaceae bacterium 44XB]
MTAETYLVILIAGFSLMVILTLILGDIDLGFISVMELGNFITLFGLFGYLGTEHTDYGKTAVTVIAVILAALVAVILQVFIFKPLMRSENSITLRDNDLEGSEGRVITSIPEDGFGEILIERKTGNVFRSAKSQDGSPVDFDEIVQIIKIEQGCAVVKKQRK